MQSFDQLESLVELVDASIVPSPIYSEFDAVTGGTITLKGKLAPAQWYLNSGDGKVSVQGQDLMCFPDFLEPSWPEGADDYLDVWAVLLVKDRNPSRPWKSDRGQWIPLHPNGDWRGLLLCKPKKALTEDLHLSWLLEGKKCRSLMESRRRQYG
ncbi:hypothetical protein NA57DRAFT_74591 [Rhizodiscina lignyota]|uniref:Uncharacterized protein n=1 Tax=Rhizodiscina lignyota TaxID=1504668 RepID=A0A9P4IJ93_9PEZI|nr:hypothetical protein NA57DRAFT_74591 [Rhizodiscina lignyota]